MIHITDSDVSVPAAYIGSFKFEPKISVSSDQFESELICWIRITPFERKNNVTLFYLADFCKKFLKGSVYEQVRFRSAPAPGERDKSGI